MLSASRRSSLTRAAKLFHTHLDHRTASYLSARGIDQRLAVRHGLGTVSIDPDYQQWWGLLCIPYITPTGVVFLKFRQMDPDHTGPKYLAPSGLKTRVYNARAIWRDSPVIGLAEGELDTIIAEEALGIPVVGIAGVQNWKAHYTRLFEGYEEVLILADNDSTKETNAGQEFADKLTRKLDNARQVTLPPGMDVSEFVLAEGADALKERCGL